MSSRSDPSKNHELLSLKICMKGLIFDQALDNKIQAKNLRGAIAAENKDFVTFHHHTETGSLVYRYPLIQYKMIENQACLIGIEQGAIEVEKIDLLGKSLNFGADNDYVILEQRVHYYFSDFGLVPGKVGYEFLSPWLALNERNYEKYHRLGSWTKRKILLEKILVGNIISMSKGLGYTVPGPIKVNILTLKEVNTSLKRNPMLGFLGKFEVNFKIPDYLGIGKSVSRGFGTVKRLMVD